MFLLFYTMLFFYTIFLTVLFSTYSILSPKLVKNYQDLEFHYYVSIGHHLVTCANLNLVI